MDSKLMKPRDENDLKIAEKAAEWLYRLKEDDSTPCRADFLAWLKHSPRHMQEFLMMTAVSRELDAVDPERQVDVQQLTSEAFTILVPLRESGPTAPVVRIQRRSSWSSRRLKAIAAASALLIVGTAVFFWQLSPTYSTAIGEQRTVKLDDGSMIYLNTQSRVQVHYTAEARDLRLKEGEALFVVERDPKRPFRVAAGYTVVRAVGTQFNVFTRADETTVSVVEGKVQISTQPAPLADVPAPVELTAGEEAKVAQARGVLKRSTSDIDKALAWRQRRLVFRDDTLADIVTEFNRYNREPQFYVSNDEVGTRRYTGTFDADDPQSLEQLLAKENDLVLESRRGEIVIRAR